MDGELMFFSSNNAIASALSNKDYSWIERLFNVMSKVCIALSIAFIIYSVSVING